MDEDISRNPVIITLTTKFPELCEQAISQEWQLIVPISSSLVSSSISLNFIQSHLLRQSPYFDGDLISLNGKVAVKGPTEGEGGSTQWVEAKNGYDTTTARRVEVVFEESLYLDGHDQGLRVLCTEAPLEGPVKKGSLAVAVQKRVVEAMLEVKTAAESEAFIRLQPSGVQALVRADRQISEFNSSYVMIEGYLEHTVAKLRLLASELQTFLLQANPPSNHCPQVEAALAAAAESYIMRGVNDKVVMFLGRVSAERETVLRARLQAAREAGVTQHTLGVPLDCRCDVSVAAGRLRLLGTCCCPGEKLQCIAAVHDAICRAVKTEAEDRRVREKIENASTGEGLETHESVALTVDALLPLNIYTLIQAQPTQLISELQYIHLFHGADLKTSKHGFAFTNLRAAVEYLESYEISNKVIGPHDGISGASGDVTPNSNLTSGNRNGNFHTASASLQRHGDSLNSHSSSASDLYKEWFNLADSSGAGQLGGPDAVSFFSRSGLPNSTLAQVWSEVDVEGRGYLTCDQFNQAMALVAKAQTAAMYPNGSESDSQGPSDPSPSLPLPPLMSGLNWSPSPSANGSTFTSLPPKSSPAPFSKDFQPRFTPTYSPTPTHPSKPDSSSTSSSIQTPPPPTVPRSLNLAHSNGLGASSSTSTASTSSLPHAHRSSSSPSPSSHTSPSQPTYPSSRPSHISAPHFPASSSVHPSPRPVSPPRSQFAHLRPTKTISGVGSHPHHPHHHNHTSPPHHTPTSTSTTPPPLVVVHQPPAQYSSQVGNAAVSPSSFTTPTTRPPSSSSDPSRSLDSWIQKKQDEDEDEDEREDLNGDDVQLEAKGKEDKSTTKEEKETSSGVSRTAIGSQVVKTVPVSTAKGPVTSNHQWESSVIRKGKAVEGGVEKDMLTSLSEPSKKPEEKQQEFERSFGSTVRSITSKFMSMSTSMSGSSLGASSSHNAGGKSESLGNSGKVVIPAGSQGPLVNDKHWIEDTRGLDPTVRFPREGHLEDHASSNVLSAQSSQHRDGALGNKSKVMSANRSFGATEFPLSHVRNKAGEYEDTTLDPDAVFKLASKFSSMLETGGDGRRSGSDATIQSGDSSMRPSFSATSSLINPVDAGAQSRRGGTGRTGAGLVRNIVQQYDLKQEVLDHSNGADGDMGGFLSSLKANKNDVSSSSKSRWT